VNVQGCGGVTVSRNGTTQEMSNSNGGKWNDLERDETRLGRNAKDMRSSLVQLQVQVDENFGSDSELISQHP
jgi:hypothetical protein